MRTLAKLVQLHTPQTGMYEITDSCKTGQQTTQLIQVRCDLETDGGGWTVILRRKDGVRENFNRVWDDYENGFGDPNGELWIGLRNIHCLTRRDDVDLIIDLKTVDGNGMTWFYDHFKVAGSNDKYRLTIGNGIGPAYGYDAMIHLNNSQFSTKDSDNDQREGTNVAADYTHFGGWWHTNGYYVQLTGIGTRNFWFNGKGNPAAHLNSPDYSHYHNIEMKIRPKTCRNEC